MMRSRSLLILVVVTLVAVAAAILVQRDDDRVAGAGEPLFPGLLDKINDVATVVCVKGGETVTLIREGTEWLVSEKHRYPADQQKARQLVIGVARLTRIEPKTSNPELYGRIGLDEPDAEGSVAVRCRFDDAGGKALAEIVVGDSRFGRADPQAEEYFVREPAQTQTWLVEGKLPDSGGVVDWLDGDVVGVGRQRVHRVVLTHPDGTQIVVGKETPSKKTFELIGVPEDMELESKWKVSDLGRAVAELDMEDVIPSSEASVSDDGRKVEMTTFDGLKVVLRSIEDGERTLARLEASFDEAAVRSEFLPGGARSEGESEFLLTADAVREEVQRLNDAWRRWTYVVPGYRAKYMTLRKEDLMNSGKSDDKEKSNNES